MPLFEYECRECGHRFEALVIGTRQPACPRCKSENLEKRASTFGVSGAGSIPVSRSGGCGSTGGG